MFEYKIYNPHCPQKMSEHNNSLNCEDVPRWRELFMEQKIRKYVKKPIPVEAVQYKDESILDWMEGKGAIDYVERLIIETPEGIVTCRKGDYVIKGVMGEFYPIRKDIFLKTYEPVEDVENGRSHRLYWKD